MRCLLTLLTVLGLGMATAGAEDPETGFLNRVYKDDQGDEYKYVLFIPPSYTGETEYPVILFLHGAGESGSDGERQAEVGLGPAIRKREKEFPFIAIFPQAASSGGVIGRWQAGSPNIERALAILDHTMSEYKTDPKRVYLTGLSMGGYGTWSLAAAHPDKWAAIVPICGGGNPENAEKIKDIPCWCFHGDQDRAVPVEQSRRMIEALKAVGGEPKYTEYEGVGHNSWDNAYGTDELYEWMLEQQKD